MKFKRLITMLLVLVLVCTFSIAFIGCDKDDGKEVSTLTGTFRYDQAIKTIETDQADNSLRIYNSAQNAGGTNLYCSVYPFNTVNGSKVCYTVSQSLKLKRDYSYSYQYSIKLTNSEEWGKDFARIEVQMNGTFTFLQSEILGEYAVTLSNPTVGAMNVYGSTVSGEGSIYAWNIKSAPSYSVDVEYELSLNPTYSSTRYLSGRTVTVIRTDKQLLDDIFYQDVMNDIALYSDYTF